MVSSFNPIFSYIKIYVALIDTRIISVSFYYLNGPMKPHKQSRKEEK